VNFFLKNLTFYFDTFLVFEFFFFSNSQKRFFQNLMNFHGEPFAGEVIVHLESDFHCEWFTAEVFLAVNGSLPR